MHGEDHDRYRGTSRPRLSPASPRAQPGAADFVFAVCVLTVVWVIGKVEHVMPRLLRLAVVAGICTPWAQAAAAETVIPIAGDVPDDGLDHVFVEFEVPDGTVEIEVRHDDLSDANILDWGLVDPDGIFRGWGGGNGEPAIVGIEAASRSYIPGPITTGPWRVVIGKAKIAEPPGQYQLEIVLRDVASLPAQPERSPYAPAPALEQGPRWYAGDFHVHSRESGDADPPIAQILEFAAAAGLDFVELSDHNTNSQLDFYGDAQAGSSVLLVPGVEYTTYDGHANGIGATAWVDHKIGQPGVTIAGAAQQYRDQGALFAINHPALDLGDICIGCAWHQELDASAIDAVEIGTGGLEPIGYLFVDENIAFWDMLCDQGAHVAPIGGSDDHSGGAGSGFSYSPLGNPTTMVYADALDVASIVAAVAAGRTVVKLQGPDDPMVELTSDVAPEGDTITADQAELHVEVVGAMGATIRFVHDGNAADEVTVDTDPFAYDLAIVAPASGEERWRVELLVDGTRRVVTGHLWITPAQAGGSSSDGGGSSGAADTSAGGSTAASSSGGTPADSGETGTAARDDDGGCGCRQGARGPAWAIALVLLALARRRR